MHRLSVNIIIYFIGHISAVLVSVILADHTQPINLTDPNDIFIRLKQCFENNNFHVKQKHQIGYQNWQELKSALRHLGLLVLIIM